MFRKIFFQFSKWLMLSKENGNTLIAIKPSRRLKQIVLIASGFFATHAFAQDSSFTSGLNGVSTEFIITSDIYRNVSGGISTGTRSLVNVDLASTFDLEAITGNNLGEAFLYVLYDNETTLSDIVGDSQVASNIDADQGLRLYEAWWDIPIGENVSIKTGLFDLNSEFDAIDTAGYFNNSSHGIGADYAQTGEGGPSIFPSTSAAIRIAWSNESTTLRYSLLDGVPGDPDDPNAFVKVNLGGDDGVLHALEFEQNFQNGFRAAIGYWGYSAEFEKINEFTNGEAVMSDNNQGIYAFVEGPIYQSDSGKNINAFIRYGVADEELNQLSSYLGFGAVMTGLVKSRPDDTLGLAVATAFNGDDYKALNNGNVDDKEIAIELTYSRQITDNLRIQPDIQYIINPGTNPSLDNALLFGVRLELGFSN